MRALVMSICVVCTMLAASACRRSRPRHPENQLQYDPVGDLGVTPDSDLPEDHR